MLRFYASVRHIYGGRIITIVGSGRTIVTTAIGETSDAIGEATKSDIGLGPRARHQWPLIYFISDLDPSGLDLQRAGRKPWDNFGALAADFRVGWPSLAIRSRAIVHAPPRKPRALLPWWILP